ncbi:MAG: CoA pyrophosphatase [Deferrisomatales bacterium]
MATRDGWNPDLPPDEPLLERVSRALRERTRRRIPLGDYQPAAVAVPLVSTDQGLAVLFTVRTAHVEQHKGEISFPGGRIEDGDADTLSAALRETWEEVGIRPEDLRVLGTLDDFVSVTGYRVTPHVVHLARPDYPFVAQPREVAEILLVPVAHLLDPTHYDAVKPEHGPYHIHYFTWGPYVVWGLTAAILKRLLDLVFHFSRSP